jgi:two-component system phosphate regulon sensor histidine kinase PhoR
MSVGVVEVAVAAALLLLVGGIAVSRERSLRRIRAVAGADAGQAAESAVSDLRQRADRADELARVQAEDLEYLTGLVGSGIMRFDDELRVLAANRAAHLYLEVAPDSLVGRQLPGRPPGRGETGADGEPAGLGDVRLDAVVRTAWRNGSAADDILLGGPDGRALSVRARRSPGGGAWLVIDDLSDLRRLQRIRTEFVDNLSHELRTPLTTVRLLTETLSRDLEEIEVPARIVDLVEKIDVETGHLVQMAGELLDLARIEQGGGQPLYLDDVDIEPIVTATLDRLRLFAQRQGVRLRAEIDDGLPPVLGDAERLGQLLINLLHNAIKFSPAGGDVTVRARPDVSTGRPDFVALEVEDHGVGIPAEDLPRIFERFYKVDKARVRGAGGTGLGLAIVRHIAEDHGGRVSVESAEGMGSTFRVAIPAAPPVPRSSPDRREDAENTQP